MSGHVLHVVLAAALALPLPFLATLMPAGGHGLRYMRCPVILQHPGADHLLLLLVLKSWRLHCLEGQAQVVLEGMAGSRCA
jgi:hypothetical protein